MSLSDLPNGPFILDAHTPRAPTAAPGPASTPATPATPPSQPAAPALQLDRAAPQLEGADDDGHLRPEEEAAFLEGIELAMKGDTAPALLAPEPMTPTSRFLLANIDRIFPPDDGRLRDDEETAFGQGVLELLK